MHSSGDQRSRSDRDVDEPYSGQEEYDTYDDADGTAGESGASYLPAWSWGWWPSLGPRHVTDEPADPYGETEVDGDGGIGDLWDEGLITLLIVGGAVLFLFPEPATSALGIILLGLGVLAWAIDWAT